MIKDATNLKEEYERQSKPPESSHLLWYAYNEYERHPREMVVQRCHGLDWNFGRPCEGDASTHGSRGGVSERAGRNLPPLWCNHLLGHHR